MTTLRLTVTSSPPGSPLAGKKLDVDDGGATLGRGSGNRFVLPDSERIVSSSHATIRFELGQYVLTDNSTNGTFINDAPSPVGPGNSVSLRAGDRIAMGKYLLTVSLHEAPAAAASASSFLDELGVAPAAIPATPAAQAPASDAGMDELDRWLEPASAPAQPQALWGTSNVVQLSPEFEDENDPLAAIDQARRSESPLGGSFLDPVPAADDDDDWWKASQNDNVDPLNQAFSAPRPAAERSPPPAPPAQPAPVFAAEPTPVPGFAADAVPAVADAEDLDALLGLGGAPAADMPAAPGEAGSDMSVPLDAMPFKPELTEPPALFGAHPDDIIPGLTSDLSPETSPDVTAAAAFDAPVAAQPSFQPAAHTPAHAPAPVEPLTRPTQVVSPSRPAAPVAAGASGDTAALLAQMLELGNLDQQQLDALTPEVVAVLQVTIRHLLELLRARSSIKNELRLDRTMIQPVENNPLKFALTERDALRYLFGEHSGAYMSGSRAVTEAFDDVAAHQMALLAGMRSAYEKMLARFSPQALETRFGEAAAKGLLANKKARLWDAYADYFDTLSKDPETSFTRLFGEDFASAYETQVDDIKSSKKDR